MRNGGEEPVLQIQIRPTGGDPKLEFYIKDTLTHDSQLALSGISILLFLF